MIQEQLTSMFHSGCYALVCARISLGYNPFDITALPDPGVKTVGSIVVNHFRDGVDENGWVSNPDRIAGASKVYKIPLTELIPESYHFEGGNLYNNDVCLGKVCGIAGNYEYGVSQHFVMLSYNKSTNNFAVVWDPYTDSNCVSKGKLTSVRVFIQR